jgi:legumain
MKWAILALIFGCYHLAEGANWALIAAGSNGYSNYRHQADVAHAYQLLKKNGVPASNIVLMMYDDVANNARNPYKGNLINRPNGPNVYAGIRVDYRGRDCNARNFLHVLQGNSYELSNVGSGRSIQSTHDDHVFVYYADHGNKGIIGFPGGALYSRDLNAAIDRMYSQNQYKKMVFYIEACFSGSMFYNRLSTKKNVYAITAANRFESSYSCYYDRRRRAYLGDEFSVKWMENTEAHNIHSQTLWHQYLDVKQAVGMSHVSAFGDVSGMGNMPIAEFQSGGYYHDEEPKLSYPAPPITDAVPTWDVPYMTLMHQLQDANTTEERMQLLHEMQQEQTAHMEIQQTMEDIVKKISPAPASMMYVQETQTTEEQDDCYEQSIVKYLETCKKFEGLDYAMKNLYVFANLCNKGVTIEKISESIEEVCA